MLLIVCVTLANLALARGAARTRDVAIRRALGATPWQLLRATLVENLCLGLAGGAIGLLAAWLLGRVVSSLLFAVRPHDGWTMAAVTGVLAAVSAAACYLPARRVTRAEPLGALRYE